MFGRRDSSLVGSLIATMIFMTTFFVCIQNWQLTRKIQRETNSVAIGELYATELLELFRGMETSTRLKAFFASDPVRTNYLLCAHINILDRTRVGATDNRALNPDPIATLPQNLLLDQPDPWCKPNRWYQVQIMNAKTLSYQNDRCNKLVKDVALGADELFSVTVGVSWYSGKRCSVADSAKLKRVVINTLLPGDFIPHKNVYRATLGGSAPDRFFTSNEGEFLNAVANGYSNEGKKFHTLTAGTRPGLAQVYRLYNPNNGQHYLTSSGGEKDTLVGSGWFYDSDEGYLFTSQVPNTHEVYHLEYTSTGEHLFTVSNGEKTSLTPPAGTWTARASLGFAPKP